MDWIGLRSRRKLAVVVAAVVVGLLTAPVSAQQGEGRRGRRAAGILFLGGSVFMVRQALDFKDQGDAFYARYQRATDPVEIERLYQRANNRDIKSQVSWAVSAAFAITGVRLLLTSGAEPEPSRSQERVSLRLPGGVELTGTVGPRTAGMRLRRCFF